MSKRERTIDILIKVVLIIIIILLLIHNCNLQRERNDYKNRQIPNGNVDIIEIKCDSKDKCDIEPIPSGKCLDGDNCDDEPKDDGSNNNKNNNSSGKNNNSNSNNNNNNNNNNAEPVNNDEDENYDLIVEDSEVTWNGVVPARIFTNSMYVLDDVIAPESSNTYQFVVKNGSDYKLKYTISFLETNPYMINMKYKLKKNDTYIIDHYVSYNELITSEYYIESGANDTYYLEWKWVSSDNDTEIGLMGDASYELKISVEAESVNE